MWLEVKFGFLCKVSAGLELLPCVLFKWLAFIRCFHTCADTRESYSSANELSSGIFGLDLRRNDLANKTQKCIDKDAIISMSRYG